MVDEVRYGVFHFDHVVIDAIVDVHETLVEAALKLSGEKSNALEKLPRTFITFGSWIGGDRDGNPYVTPDVTRHTLAYQRSVIINRYLRDGRYFNALSHSENWVEPTERLSASIGIDAELLPEVALKYGGRYQLEPFRLKLSLSRQSCETLWKLSLQSLPTLAKK